MTTLEAYSITDRLGYITADNHGANDTMCKELEQQLPTLWQAEQRRLRCVGHIINIAVQAFFFAKDKEAVNLAIEPVTQLRPLNRRRARAAVIRRATTTVDSSR